MDEKSLQEYAIAGSADARRILAEQGQPIDWEYAITHLSDGTPLSFKDIVTVDTEMKGIIAQFGGEKAQVRAQLLQAIEGVHVTRTMEKRYRNRGKLQAMTAGGPPKRGTNKTPPKKKRK